MLNPKLKHTFKAYRLVGCGCRSSIHRASMAIPLSPLPRAIETSNERALLQLVDMNRRSGVCCSGSNDATKNSIVRMHKQVSLSLSHMRMSSDIPLTCCCSMSEICGCAVGCNGSLEVGTSSEYDSSPVGSKHSINCSREMVGEMHHTTLLSSTWKLAPRQVDLARFEQWPHRHIAPFLLIEL